MKLSVVIPVFNEKATVATIVERVRAVDLPIEIIVVDDGSTDGTREVLASIQSRTIGTIHGVFARLVDGMPLIRPRPPAGTADAPRHDGCALHRLMQILIGLKPHPPVVATSSWTT